MYERLTKKITKTLLGLCTRVRRVLHWHATSTTHLRHRPRPSTRLLASLVYRLHAIRSSVDLIERATSARSSRQDKRHHRLVGHRAMRRRRPQPPRPHSSTNVGPTVASSKASLVFSAETSVIRHRLETWSATEEGWIANPDACHCARATKAKAASTSVCLFVEMEFFLLPVRNRSSNLYTIH